MSKVEAMNMNRRTFLRFSSLIGASSFITGCASPGLGFFNGTEGAPMQGFRCAPMKRLRVGIVGTGDRGTAFIERALHIAGVDIVAICDINQKRLDIAQKRLADAKRAKAREYYGETAYRALCDAEGIDVIYNTTPWQLHVDVALRAMRGGKHVFTEVPSAFTVDECWELVETSEQTKRNCMQLENCCYGEIEMLTLNLARLGMFGEIIHAEGAYIHDLRWMTEATYPAAEYWRYPFNLKHAGNQYPTHGLVPLCLTMDVNRGDRLDYLVSIDSKQANFREYMKARMRPENPRYGDEISMGDMNSTLIRTVKGKTMLIQHDVSSPRPYSRIQFLSGTKGAICDYPFRVGFESKVGESVHSWYPEAKADEIRRKYRHPMWKQFGDVAGGVGGHGGMDFIMDLRWIYCLQNGLPLDMDVYDLATTCCICELTEKSATHRGQSCDIPDFTRGAWKTTSPLGVEAFDMDKVKLLS